MFSFLVLLASVQAAAIPVAPTIRASQQMVANFNSPTDSPQGFVRFTFADVNDGVDEMIVGVRLTNLDPSQAPFSYHIHTDPVPAQVNNPAVDCVLAKGHLAAPSIPDSFVCDQNDRSRCQQGDLSGKFDKIKADRIKTKTSVYRHVYSDEALSLTSIRGRSIVIHNKDKARIACANIGPIP